MFRNRTALITGASMGIGRELARLFARDGAKLALVAYGDDGLGPVAEELRGRHPGLQVEAICADLREPDGPAEAFHKAQAALGSIEVLVNNAGVGEYGRFAGQDIEALDGMMRLNMRAVVRLTHLALPDMLQRKRGWILNTASAAGLQPTPYISVYSASKAFVYTFSMGLWVEVRHKKIAVTCCCPGVVDTHFHRRGGLEAKREDFTKGASSAEFVAQQAYKALAKGRPLVIPGWKNRALVWAQRSFTRKGVVKVLGSSVHPGGKPE